MHRGELINSDEKLIFGLNLPGPGVDSFFLSFILIQLLITDFFRIFNFLVVPTTRSTEYDPGPGVISGVFNESLRLFTILQDGELYVLSKLLILGEYDQTPGNSLVILIGLILVSVQIFVEGF